MNHQVQPLESRLLLSTYFVAQNGSDTADGSQATPFRSIQHAVDVARGFDTIRVGAGNFDPFTVNGKTGSWMAPFEIVNEGTRAVINTTSTYAINIGADSSFVHIYGLLVTGGGGVKVAGHDNSLSSVIVQNSNAASYQIDAATSIRMDICYAESSRAQGVNINNSTDVIIDGLIAHDNITAIEVNNSASIRLWNNLLRFNGRSIKATGVNTLSAENNLIYSNNLGAQFNTISNGIIVNNTIDQVPDVAVSLTGAGSGNHLRNNIVLNRTAAGASFAVTSQAISGYDSDDNILTGYLTVDGSVVTPAAWVNRGLDVHSEFVPTATIQAWIAANFGDTYRLKVTSSAIDRGTSDYAPVGDILYNHRFSGLGYDIGAYEYIYKDPPTAPPDLRVSIIGDSVVLTWTDAANNEDGYSVERSTIMPDGSDAWVAWLADLPANSTSFTDPNPIRGSASAYRVSAFNENPVRGYSFLISVNVPPLAAPANVVATALSTTQVKVTWEDKSSNESGYIVTRKIGDTGTYIPVATLPANSTSFTNSGLSASRKYIYQVKAYNASGVSGESAPAAVFTPLPTPTNLVASATAYNTVVLNWKDNATNESGYKIYRKTGTGAYAYVGYVGANITTFKNTGLAASTTYTYYIVAYRKASDVGYLESFKSSEVTTTTPAFGRDFNFGTNGLYRGVPIKVTSMVDATYFSAPSGPTRIAKVSYNGKWDVSFYQKIHKRWYTITLVGVSSNRKYTWNLARDFVVLGLSPSVDSFLDLGKLQRWQKDLYKQVTAG